MTRGDLLAVIRLGPFPLSTRTELKPRLSLSKLHCLFMFYLPLRRESGLLFSLSSPTVVYKRLIDLEPVSWRLTAVDYRRFLLRVFEALPERSRIMSRLRSLILGTKLNLRVFSR